MDPVRIERESDVAVVIVDNPPVNALSTAVRTGLLRAFRDLAADPDTLGVVVMGAGRDFIAGADIREMEAPPIDPVLPEVIEAMEALPKPIVAAISGAALGGGFEIALACDHRLAAPGAVVGLPEVSIGIIPGAGGTQRLPRLLNPAVAADLIANAKRVPAAEALRLTLVDRIVEGDLRAEAVAEARRVGKRRISELSPPPYESEVFAEAAADLKTRARSTAAIRAVEAVEAALTLPFAEGLAFERRTMLELRKSPEAAALRHLFFAEREALKVPGLEGAAPRPVRHVGVIGAGTMGSGIAVALLDSGLAVTLIERDHMALETGVKRVRGVYDRVAKRLPAGAAEERLSRLSPSIDWEPLRDADLVIEAVFEDMGVKQETFRRLDDIVRPGAVLATNTSYLDIDEIARATARPADVLGLHFFSPANVMRLLEVVRGAATAPDVLATGLRLARRLGKVAVVARVGEGFIGNRIFSAYRKQAEILLEEGAYPEDVDKALEAYGFAMGPFSVFDLAGLDIGWATRKRLAPTRDPRERYVEIADRICEQGRFGRKTGRGYYVYPEGARRGEPDPEVRALIEAESARKGIQRRPIPADEIQRRALAAMVNEGAKVLAEGIALRASDIDVTLVHGYGFPAQKGGPMFAADARGLAAVLRDVEAMHRACGFGYEPAPLLVELARSGSSFAEWDRRQARAGTP